MDEIKIGTNADKLYNQKFGRLTFIKPVAKTKNKQIKWLLSCECGGSIVAVGNDIKSGHTRSCGCLASEILAKRNYKHGHMVRGSLTLTAKSYHYMKARINSPSYHAHERYTKRGITICKRWLDEENGFKNFIDDMGERTEKWQTLDRIDNNKGYSPDNCRWADMATQSVNRSNTIRVDYNGSKMTLREIANKLGTTYSRVYYQYRRGVSPDNITT